MIRATESAWALPQSRRPRTIARLSATLPDCDGDGFLETFELNQAAAERREMEADFEGEFTLEDLL